VRGQPSNAEFVISVVSLIILIINTKIGRVYDLVEEYQPDYARKLGVDNDCSWMTHSSLLLLDDTEDYVFSSTDEQYVTILVVPQFQLDDFDLHITIDGAQVISSANPGSSFIDWVQVKVRAGAHISARTAAPPNCPLPCTSTNNLKQQCWWQRSS
jgi:hypothetical protein